MFWLCYNGQFAQGPRDFALEVGVRPACWNDNEWVGRVKETVERFEWVGVRGIVDDWISLKV